MLEKVLESCKYVLENANHVTIDDNKLDLCINEINHTNLKNWLSSNPYHLLELDIETIINFLLIFESICYSFWGQPKWTINTEFGEKDGCDALLYVLLQYVRKNKTTDFSYLSLLEFRDIVKGNIEIPLLEKRYHTIINISRIVNEKMGGNFYEYSKDITTDHALFHIIIEHFPSFKDERKYNDKTIYFYKLAQLLTSDILHIREQIEGIKVDYSNLLGCADYKIPQAMRALGMIKYNTELSNIVDSEKEIAISSSYEVEIRASMIVVIDTIKNKLNNVHAIEINDVFFVSSKMLKDKVKPYHLCRNTNY